MTHYTMSAPVAVNSTPVHLTELDIATVCRSLRRTLSKIHDLTPLYGFCFACIAKLAKLTNQTPSTVRKHIARLIALGIVRREEVPGYADRLFICPVVAWKNSPRGAQNGPTQPIVERRLEKRDKQTSRERVATPEVGLPPALPVVLSAKASGEGESHIIQNDDVVADDPHSIAALLRASIEAAENEMQALESGPSVQISAHGEHIPAICTAGEQMEGLEMCAVLDATNLPAAEIPEMLASTFKAPNDAKTEQNQANNCQKAPIPPPCAYQDTESRRALETSPKPLPQDCTTALPAVQSDAIPVQCSSRQQFEKIEELGISPEQTTTLGELLQAGVGNRQAEIMARGDARKAQDALKTLRAYLAAGKEVPSPGGLLWSLWNREDFRFVERSAGRSSGPVYVKDTPYHLAPTAASILPPGMDRADASADAARRAMVAQARSRTALSCPV